MKLKFLFFLICPFLCSAVYAQDSAKVTYGIKIGLNSYSTTRKSTGTEINTVNMDSKISWQGSAFVDIPVFSSWSIQPAILYTNKGQFKDLTGTSNDLHYKITYLELPVNMIYHYKKFFVGAGPFISTALKGTVKQGNQNEKDVRFGSTYIIGPGSSANDEWEQYDYGAAMLLGYKLHHFSFSLNYDLGLRDIDPNPLYKSQTRTGAITVGLSF